MRLFLLRKTLARLNSFGNGLLLLELSSLAFGGSLRATGGKRILFEGKIVLTNKNKKREADSSYLLKQRTEIYLQQVQLLDPHQLFSS